MSRISEEQQQWIESLKCERLSCNEENRDYILLFNNTKNEALASYLYEKAWDDDLSKRNICYIVKNQHNDVLFYFSLRCGLLFEETMTPDMIAMCTSYVEDNKITEDAKNYQIVNSLSDKDLSEFLSSQYFKLREHRKAAKQEKIINESSNVKLVLKTIPAIELTYFCKNESCQIFDEALFSQHKLGEIIFWFKVLDIVDKCNVGAEYIYLFAANLDENQSLITYYANCLKFSPSPVCGTNKPVDSQSCKFMCLEIQDARIFLRNLIDNFNPDPGDDLI